MKKETRNKLWVVSVYAIAMGFLEAVIVIYLRKLYYPAGFDFPLRGFIEPQILGIEWVREFFTIVMLAAVAILAGKKAYEKIAYFCLAFAVWDIFYYIFLKISLNWPSSFLTWDLLFLIPWPWIGPVLAPLILSITLIVLALFILSLQDNSKKEIKFSAKEWILFILGSIIVLYTFLSDYCKLIISNGYAKDFFSLATNEQFSNLVSSFAPKGYNWILFALGEIIIFLGIISLYLRARK